MLLLLGIVLLVLWVLGFLAFHVAGGLIHLFTGLRCDLDHLALNHGKTGHSLRLNYFIFLSGPANRASCFRTIRAYHQFLFGQAASARFSLPDDGWQAVIEDASVASVRESSARRSGVVNKVRMRWFRAESYTAMSTSRIVLPGICDRQVKAGWSNNLKSGDAKAPAQDWWANSSEVTGAGMLPSNGSSRLRLTW